MAVTLRVHGVVKYLPRMPDAAKQRGLLAAIDRADRWVIFEMQPDKTPVTAQSFGT